MLLRRSFSLGGLLLLAAACLDAGLAVREFRYQVRGEVRLLLVWLGRDRVGGGSVRIRSGDRWEEISVLFGSDRTRVPGGINRWGYAVERTFYSPGNNSIVRSTFDGLMSELPEQSVSEALAAARKRIQRPLHLIRSEVLPDHASSEVRILAQPALLDYRTPRETIEELLRRADAISVSESRRLLNQAVLYGPPQGFLSAVLALSRSVSANPRQPPATYVFHSKHYQLEVRDVHRDKDKIRIAFEIVNPRKKIRTPIELWFPSGSPLSAVPTRIVIQPNWWLRLRLDLLKEQQ